MSEVRIRDKVDALVMLKHIIAYRDEYDAKLARREDGVRAGIHFRDAVFTLLHGISSDDVAAPSGMAEPVAWQVKLVADSSWLEIPANRVDEFRRDAHEVRALYATPPASDLREENERLRAENAKLKADRLYIIGCNDGYDAAMEQAAEFCDGAEAEWRKTADKAHELDHNEAMSWSATATAKAETCAGLASTIRTATTIPLIRGVGLCMLDGKDAEASAALQTEGK